MATPAPITEDLVKLTLARDANSHLVITFTGPKASLHREQYVKKLAQARPPPALRYERTGGDTAPGLLIRSCTLTSLREGSDGKTYYLRVKGGNLPDATDCLPNGGGTGRTVLDGTMDELSVSRSYTREEWRRALGRWHVVSASHGAQGSQRGW